MTLQCLYMNNNIHAECHKLRLQWTMVNCGIHLGLNTNLKQYWETCASSVGMGQTLHQ